MDDKERLEAILEYTGKRINGLAKDLGFPNGNILYNIKGERNGISASLAAKIAERYPEINQNWIWTGKGTMIVEKNEESDDLKKRVAFLEDHIKGLNARVELLEIKLKPPKINAPNHKKKKRAV